MDLLEFIGHFHPVLVHLPIGILLTAILFEWLRRRKGFRKLRKSVRVLLLLGFLAALCSSITGYLLAQSGEYDAELLNRHEWLGFSVTAVSLGALLLSGRKATEMKLAYGVVIFSLGLLIIFAGHAGGSLTHGAEFLEPPPVGDWFGSKQKNRFLTVDLKSALLYKDLIEPLLNDKCTRCHGPSRQKGKLRLDKPEFIMRGGKDGPAIDTAQLEESEIIKRIHLDITDEDHMPPKEKSQLTRQETDLIAFWIINGADFKKKLNAMPGADSMISLLVSSDNNGSKNMNSGIPESDVAMPDARTLDNLRSGGVVVSLLAQGKGYVSINLFNADTTRFSVLLADVLTLKQQTLELKLMGCRLSHSDWARLGGLTALMRLNLEGSNVQDGDLQSLSALPRLQYINLVGTPVTTSGLKQLAALKSLTRIFLYHTRIEEKDLGSLRPLFPGVTFDMGNYVVPMLSSDTTELTKPYVVPLNP